MQRLILSLLTVAFVFYLINPSFRTRIHDHVTGIFNWNADSIDQNPGGYLKWNQAQLDQLARQIKARQLELDYHYERASRQIQFDIRYEQVVNQDLKEAKELFRSAESQNQWPVQSGHVSLDRQTLANTIVVLNSSSQTTQERLKMLRLQVEQYPEAKAELGMMLGEVDVALLQLGLVEQQVGAGTIHSSIESINSRLMDLKAMSEAVGNQSARTTQRNGQMRRTQSLMSEERLSEILSP